MSQRTSVFAKPQGTIDISDFKPKERQDVRPLPTDIDQVASGGPFKSRDAAPDAPVTQRSTKRPPMVYRTGRNVTVSVKATPETNELFYEITRAQGWKVAETFERALQALERELGAARKD